MIRKIVKIAVFLLIANAVYQIAPVAMRHFEFKDALQELVLYGQKSPDPELVNRALALASENHVPLDREDVRVRRETGSVHIRRELCRDAAVPAPLQLPVAVRHRREVTGPQRSSSTTLSRHSLPSTR